MPCLANPSLQVMDQNKKRAAFDDITNQFADEESLDEVCGCFLREPGPTTLPNVPPRATCLPLVPAAAAFPRSERSGCWVPV